MSSVRICPDVYWVGAVDWNIRHFHGHTYQTRRGTTYNAYLILDKKIALVDTVLSTFSGEMIQNIRQVVEPGKIDYIIANHVETDHSGALPEVLRLCPRAKVFCTTKGKVSLYKHYYGEWDFQVVKTSDKLSLGKKTLSFIEAPMIHWPDSMFTYCHEEELLMPNDAFGQHLATSERFDDEVEESILFDEALKYYANILWPLSSIILKKLEEIQKLNIPIRMIAPSHGIIWRKSPEKIIGAYLTWAKNEYKPRIVLVYETMWGSTEKMAYRIAEGVRDAGISVKVFDVNSSDRTEIIAEMFNSKAYIMGSSTHDNDMLPNIAGFLDFLKGLKPKNRLACVFGSYGWSGGAVKGIEDILKNTGIEIGQPSFSLQYVPNGSELDGCFLWGKGFAEKIKTSQ